MRLPMTPMTSGKTQRDLDLCRFLVVEPTAMKLLVNESTRVRTTSARHSRRTPRLLGPIAADPADLTWARLADHVDRRP